MKNSFKKIVTTSALALSILAGSATMPSQRANAGIVIGVGVPLVLAPAIGLAISSAGFFWGIQYEGLHPWAAVLFVLEEKLDAINISAALQQKHPELETFIADEIAQIVMNKANAIEFNAEGLKEVTLSLEELNSVLDLLNVRNSKLANELVKELTQSALRV